MQLSLSKRQGGFNFTKKVSPTKLRHYIEPWQSIQCLARVAYAVKSCKLFVSQVDFTFLLVYVPAYTRIDQIRE
jgi:hypothetical protein